MIFKIGDEIIMTADSRKGAIFNDLFNGDYVCHIKSIGPLNTLDIEMHENKIYYNYFNLDGSCSTHPGMSIRPAEEKVASTTPSQWIEGAPTNKGNYWVQMPDERVIVVAVDDKVEMRVSPLRYCPISELPPPPPAKEVEAYGILEAIDKLMPVGTPITGAIVSRISLYRHFYSQLATAENLEKYLITKRTWMESGKPITIDGFINLFKITYGDKLLFTSAALEELGVK